MKYLVMCEGQNEKVIIELLLNNNLKDLIKDIKKSRNLGKNNKDEIYLADLLK